MIFVFVLLGIVIWGVLGYVINVINGYLSAVQLQKYYKDEHDMNRDLMIRNYQEMGTVDISNTEIIADALLWPRTLYLAWKGQRKIIESLKEK